MRDVKVRRIRRRLSQTASILAATLAVAKLALADPLNPGSFTSLGTLNVTSGSITINTDTLAITGAATFGGATISQGGGNPEVAVFTFTNFNIDPGVTINVTGSRPLALLSQGSMSIASAISLNGGSAGVPTAGAAGPAGGYAGGTGGTTGSAGQGPGGGGGTGPEHDAGGGGYGGAGGNGQTAATPGANYGNLLSLLQGGSGGGGASESNLGLAGGGGGGAGAIEIGALGTLSFTSSLTSNGGSGANSIFDGGGGAGGGILIHAGSIGVIPLSAAGGNATGASGGGGGGRIAVTGGIVNAATLGSQIAMLANSVNGGTGNQAGTAGVLTFRHDQANVQPTQSLDIGITPGQTGQTDPRIEVLPKSLTVQVGGTATLISPITWGSGGTVSVTGGRFNVVEDLTFAAGSTLNWSTGSVVVASGRTLTFDGGVGTGAGSLSDGATLRVINGGQFTGANSFHIANNNSAGALLVDGSGSKFLNPNGQPTWGGNSGETAAVTFSNGGAGTIGTLRLSTNGGSSTVLLATGGQLSTSTMLITGNFTSGSNPLIMLSGGTLTSNGTATFRNGTVVNLSSGGLVLNNNATFSGSATLNWFSTGALNIASGRTLNIDGGFLNIPNGFKILSDGATLKVTNGGKVDAAFSLRIGDGSDGTLLVDGLNSSIYTSSSATQWARLSGDVANVTFSNFGVGTFADVLTIAGSGGTAMVNVNSNSTLSTTGLSVGSTSLGSTATINIAGGTLQSSGTMVLRTGTTVNFIAGTMLSGGTMTLNGNAQVLLSTGGDKVLRSGRLNLSNTAKINLADNDMIIEGATPPATVRGYLVTGRNGGDWLGNFLTSSSAAADPTHRALGYALASDIFNGGGGTFDGVDVNAFAVLVKYTYPGDANLDGAVDINDLYQLASHFNGASGQEWVDADFNYDGLTNVADLTLLAMNWQAGVGSPLSAPLGQALISVGLPNVAVPEPVALTALVALGFLLPRRRV